MKGVSLRSYLFAGLIVWLPILVTMGVIRFIVDLLDETLALLPQSWQPIHWIGHDVPGLGVVLSFVILISTGIFATNFFGQKLVGWGESILSRIPLVRSIYNAVKQVMNAILSSNSQAFRKVLLIEYPRKGSWSLAFMTGTVNPAIKTGDDDLISVFIPTTPNPTSGFLIMIPKKDAIEVEMSVDEALKCIISLGVMQPSIPKGIN